MSASIDVRAICEELSELDDRMHGGYCPDDLYDELSARFSPLWNQLREAGLNPDNTYNDYRAGICEHEYEVMIGA
jgi:hypothetical protein